MAMNNFELRWVLFGRCGQKELQYRVWFDDPYGPTEWEVIPMVRASQEDEDECKAKYDKTGEATYE